MLELVTCTGVTFCLVRPLVFLYAHMPRGPPQHHLYSRMTALRQLDLLMEPVHQVHVWVCREAWVRESGRAGAGCEEGGRHGGSVSVNEEAGTPMGCLRWYGWWEARRRRY